MISSKIFTFFFTKSKNRYEELVNKLKENLENPRDRILLPKRVSTTRWSSRADAIRSLKKGYEQYKELLQQMSSINDEAKGLCKIISKLETCFYIDFWSDILEQMNKVSIKLQSPTTDLNTAITCVKSLKSFIENLRNNFNHYESLGKDRSGLEEYSDKSKRVRRTNTRLNPLDYPNQEEIILRGSENFRIKCFLPVIDQLTTSLHDRISAYEEIGNHFGFL